MPVGVYKRTKKHKQSLSKARKGKKKYKTKHKQTLS